RGVRFGVSFPDLQDLRALSQDFTGVAATTTQRYNLTGAGDPREVQAAAVTGDVFEVLQVRPEIGHGFTTADDRTPLALLAHGLWVTNFGRDPGILGRSISLDGRSFTVVGVMPAGFEFPNQDVQVWTPIGESLSQSPQGAETNRHWHFLNAVARLARDVGGWSGSCSPRARCSPSPQASSGSSCLRGDSTPCSRFGRMRSPGQPKSHSMAGSSPSRWGWRC